MDEYSPMNGKGSAPRPIKDRKNFGRRWEETFNKKEIESMVWSCREFAIYRSPPTIEPLNPVIISPPYDR
jgi:hypothetical protein